MAYVEPQAVLAPRNLVRWVEVMCNTGPGGWSVARIGWGDSTAIGMRWNGDEGPGIGNPQSRGNATWFILPDIFEDVVLEKIEELNMSKQGGLLEQYAAMAKDVEREQEAEEWTEGLIGDASSQG